MLLLARLPWRSCWGNSAEDILLQGVLGNSELRFSEGEAEGNRPWAAGHRGSIAISVEWGVQDDIHYYYSGHYQSSSRSLQLGHLYRYSNGFCGKL